MLPFEVQHDSMTECMPELLVVEWALIVRDNSSVSVW